MATRPADPDDAVTSVPAQDPENISDSVDPSKLPRGASEGPLSKLTPVYVDCETFMSETVSLDDMTLRQYLAASYTTAIALAVGNVDPVQVFYTEKNPGPPGPAMVTDELRQVLVYLATDPNYVFVAHNASFDMRVLRFHLGVPHPINVWCSMEGAMGAWPELPGGFGLANLAKRLRLPEDRRKLELDLHRLQKVQDKCPIAAAKCDDQIVAQMKAILAIGGIPWPADDVITRDMCAFVLAIYNQRDVEAMRDVFLLQAARIPAVEQGVALRTHHQRRHHFMVDSVKLDEFVVKMDQNAAYAEKEVEAMVGTGDLRAVFNRENDNGVLTSIRYARLKKLVNEKLANEQFESTSLKKLSPLQLARNPKVFELLTQTTRAGKMMSHKRRAKVFAGVSEVDVELGVYRAHTGRFSSPSTGKGLNIHNVPKHDKAVAEPVRKLFKVPTGYCLVRGDLANVEFRCLLEGSPVLTDSGWKNIEKVLDVDLVWDGVAFVKHGGVVCNGRREVIEVHGVWMTPDHPVLTSNGWVAAEKAATLTFHSPDSDSAGGLVRAPTPSTDTAGTGSGSCANAVGLPTSHTPTCSEESAGSAGPARPNADGVSGGSSQTKCCVPSGSNATNGSSQTASTPSTRIGSTTAAAGSPSTPPCATEKTFSATLSLSKVGTTQRSPSTGSTTTETTAQGTSAAQREQCKPTTSGARTGTVYDILNCGPRNRFVAGELIVHNCEGYLTGATNVFKMFEPLKGGNIFTDPYSSTWQNMTGVKISKKDPVRQVAKSATLGLGFCMSPPGYAKVLLNVLADKKSGVTEAILHDIIIKNFWVMPRGDRVSKIMTMLGCSQVVALSAYYIHKLFNDAYPEFRRTAYWLVKVIEEVAASGTDRDQARRRIDEMYKTTDAPNRDLIGLEIDDDPLTLYPSVRACCGPWPRTVCWREPHMRKTDFAGADDQKKLTIRKATGEYKVFTPQLAIENVTQAAARNALCMGVEHLEHLGFKDVIHVHDEIMILCKREREAVLAARDALLTCFGPGHSMPYGWSILVKPDEVTLTESLYEDENDVAKIIKNKEGQEVPGPDRWGRIERNEPGCLLNLP